MKIIKMKNLKNEERRELLKRSQIDASGVLDTVSKIVGDVREKGDLALHYYTEKFDGVKLNRLK
ncbi:MAG TPA: histidinol dehydrogenase, partial [Methanobacterium sp.]